MMNMFLAAESETFLMVMTLVNKLKLTIRFLHNHFIESSPKMTQNLDTCKRGGWGLVFSLQSSDLHIISI
eukprot:UN09211